MARTITEIYQEAKEHRNKYLALTAFENSSKMSILDSITWVTSACIWTFENMLDVFKVDLSNDLQFRVNGNAAYYANALLKYQRGDQLMMNNHGTSFSYPTINPSKRIITRVSYAEVEEEGFHDRKLVLKVATGSPGAYERIGEEDLLAIRAYFSQIAFAGTQAAIVSRQGDVLIPRLTVYHDGAVTEAEVYQNIEEQLNLFIEQVGFDGVIYAQRIIDAIQRAEHVLDVHIDKHAGQSQGIFVAQYDDDNNLIPVQDGVGYEQLVGRSFVPNSGYLKQSSKQGAEEAFPTWRESIVLKIEQQ